VTTESKWRANWPVNGFSATVEEGGPWWRIPLKHLLIILLSAYFLFFFRMSSYDLWSPDEPRYAQVAREMLRSGDWIVPHLNGQIYTEKPPLYFWLVAALSKPLGDVNELTARFPSATASLLLMLLTYFFGSWLLGRREALLGTLIMATSAQFVGIGRIGVIDMLLALSISAALCLFCAAYARRAVAFYLAGFASLAPAALAKGPVGLVVPVAVMFVFIGSEIVLRREGAWRESLRFTLCLVAGLALVALVVAPWWRAAYVQSEGVYGSISVLAKQTGGRMFDSYSHRRPFFYYLYNIPWQLLPWTFFIPLTVRTLKREANLRAHQGLRFLFVWFAAIIVFFTLISGKRSQYILPLFPAASLLMSWALIKRNPFEGRLRERNEYWVPCAGLALASAVALPVFTIISYVYLREIFWFALAAAIVGETGLFLVARRLMNIPPLSALLGVAVATILISAALFGYVAPAADKYLSARSFCTAVRGAIEEGDSLYFYQTYRPNINYYMGRNMTRLNSNEEVMQALGKDENIYVVLEHKRLQLLEAGDFLILDQIARGQVGSRDLVCVLVHHAG